MAAWVWITVVAALTALTRVIYWQKYVSQARLGDFKTHLLLVQAIRQNKGRIPKKVPQFLLDWNDYPNGFHRLIAALPFSINAIERWGAVVPILCDTVLVAWIGWLMMLSGGKHFAWLLLFPAISVFWQDKVRGFQFGERAFGTLWGNIYLGAMGMWITSNDWLWVVIAAVATTFYSTSSKFAWQAVTFLSLMSCLGMWTLKPFVLFMVCIGFSTLITQGYNLKVLRGLILYARFYQTHRAKRALFKNYYRTLYQEVLSRFKLYGLYKTPLTRLFMADILPIAFLWVLIQSGTAVVSTPWVVMGLSGIFLVFLTATERLKFLGHPIRYLEYSVLPMMVFLSHFSLSLYGLAFGVAWLLVGVSLFVQWRFHNLPQAEQSDHEIEPLFKQLVSFQASTILTVPLKLSVDIAYRMPQHQFVMPLTHCHTAKDYLFLFETLIPKYYPFPGQALAALSRQFGATWVIVDKTELTRYEAKYDAFHYDWTDLSQFYEDNRFQILSVEPVLPVSIPNKDSYVTSTPEYLS